MTIRWTEKAASDLESIYDFIAKDNESAALDVVIGLHDSVARLASFPNLGRIAGPFFPDDSRVLTAPPYLIFYRVLADAIMLDSIVHGNRKH